MTLLSAGQLFQYAEQQALNGVFLKVPTPTAAATYMALSTSATSGVLQSTETTMAGTTINEYLTSTGYARQSMARDGNGGPARRSYTTQPRSHGDRLRLAPGTANGVSRVPGVRYGGKYDSGVRCSRPRVHRQSETRFKLAASTGSAGVGFLCQVVIDIGLAVARINIPRAEQCGARDA